MTSSGKKKTVYIILGIIISIALIYLLFRNIDFNKLWTALSTANYWWLIPNILMIILTMYQRAYRWKFMLKPIKLVKFDNLLAATCIGFMANNVLPMRLGEFARAYSLSSQDKEISKSASLATIFVERMIFDLVALLIIFGAVLTFSDSLRSQLENNIDFGREIILGAKFAIFVALAGLGIMLVFALKPEQIGNTITRYLPFLPDRIKDMIKLTVEKFSHGLKFMIDMKAVLNVGAQTLLIWILMGASNYFVFLAFGFDIPFDASFVLLVVVSILIMTPSSPGFIGVYHYGVVISLGVYGITDEEARACALVLHAAQYIVVTLMGFYFLKKEHLSLKQLEEGVEKSN